MQTLANGTQDDAAAAASGVNSAVKLIEWLSDLVRQHAAHGDMVKLETKQTSKWSHEMQSLVA